MIETKIVENVTEAEALVPRWRSLLDRASVPEPVLTPTWLLSWWKVFGSDGERGLRLVTMYEGEELVGLVPVLSRRASYRRALPFRRLELVGTGEDEADEICSDYVGVLASKGREESVTQSFVEAVLGGALGAWDELVMPTMNGEDPTAAALARAFESGGARAVTTPAGQCPYVTLPDTWDAYLKELDSSRRYTVTRTMRDLDKWAGPGGYELKRASNDAELAEGRKILHELHGERWGEEGHSGVFASEKFTRFHDRVMPELLRGVDGSLDLLWLTVKGDPIAAAYNIIYGNKVYFYQSGRKVDLPKGVRPGIAIHVLAMKRSIELHHREYDFLNGASQYKRTLCLATRPLVTVRATAPTLRARALEAARMGAEGAITRLKQLRDAARERGKKADPKAPHAEQAPQKKKGAGSSEPAPAEDAS